MLLLPSVTPNVSDISCDLSSSLLRSKWGADVFRIKPTRWRGLRFGEHHSLILNKENWMIVIIFKTAVCVYQGELFCDFMNIKNYKAMLFFLVKFLSTCFCDVISLWFLSVKNLTDGFLFNFFIHKVVQLFICCFASLHKATQWTDYEGFWVCETEFCSVFLFFYLKPLSSHVLTTAASPVWCSNLSDHHFLLFLFF